MTMQSSDGANTLIESQLDDRLKVVEKEWGGDAIMCKSGIFPGLDDVIRDSIEELVSDQSEQSKRLLFILETPGGFIETAQRIADTLRQHYKIVEFIVPNQAMSAGTVLVMSGNAIHMDYYSILGPIDPQIRRPGKSEFVPALGYLEQYDRLIEKAKKGGLTTAEITYLVQRFDPAEMYLYEQARDLSISLLKEWLVKYKFSNWKKTNGRKKKVTKGMRTKRAASIAKSLNDTNRWHSHGRGISMDILQNDLKLQIEDYGANLARKDAMRCYYRLLRDYMHKSDHRSLVVHTRKCYIGF
ncbi:MAG: serine dehydrogenasease [bacterium]|nr:serine dehydrogenasease [bacterium]